MIFDKENFIKQALAEDVGDGDHSSLACIPPNAFGKAKLLAKENGVLAGVALAIEIFKHVDASLSTEVLLKDGDKIKTGDVAFIVAGKKQSILKAERLVLNLMQRMSGIAGYTSEIVELLKGTKAKVLDTRKTTPLLRAIEKQAVKIGGGINHRFGLYDMIMLKDNHIDYAGGIEAAITNTKKYLADSGKNLQIEVEARNMEEVIEIMRVGGIHRIMLDNFTPAETLEAVKLINGKFETESSGGITIHNIRSYAECGVDYISVGALTHSVKSLDLSLKAIEE